MWDTTLLEGKRILVTGASSGLGRHFSVLASELGAQVLLFGRDNAKLAETQAMMTGDKHSRFTVDFDDTNHARQVLSDAVLLADSSTPLDGVFHAAGLYKVDSIRRGRPELVDRLFRSAFHSAVTIMSLCTNKKFLADNGAVVLMSSVAAHRWQLGLSLYGASKAAVESLARASSVELAARGIRVNTVVSGAVKTELLERELKLLPTSIQEEYENRHLLGFGTPSDISNTAVFLMSPGARWITGTNVLVDGGLSAD